MAVVRVLMLLIFAACAVCFGTYAFTGDLRWRHRGLVLLKWSVIAGLGFFAGLIVERVLYP